MTTNLKMNSVRLGSDSSGRVPFIFFGTGQIAAGVLAELEKNELLPALVVTAPDKPVGRGGTITPSPVGMWADAHSIETIKPGKIDEAFLEDLKKKNDSIQAPAFVVVDYGKILPKKLLDMPVRGILNMHPSLLPRLRGPSPIRSAILTDEKNTGITVMLVDVAMDHGPVVAQKKISVPNWPPRGSEFDTLLAEAGGKLLAEMLPLWQKGEIEAREQNHDIATYTKMFEKEDGLLDLAHGDPYQNLLKIRAFEGWPGTYAFFEKKGSSASRRMRVQILDAHIENGKLILDEVKPEGKGTMPYNNFAQGGVKIVD